MHASYKFNDAPFCHFDSTNSVFRISCNDPLCVERWFYLDLVYARGPDFVALLYNELQKFQLIFRKVHQPRSRTLIQLLNDTITPSQDGLYKCRYLGNIKCKY